jgi:hypothetical protein
MFYTFGSWIWVLVPLYVASEFLNRKFDRFLYEEICGSSYFFYIIHYPLLLVGAVLVARYLIIEIYWLHIILFVLGEI